MKKITYGKIVLFCSKSLQYVMHNVHTRIVKLVNISLKKETEFITVQNKLYR